MVSVPVKSETRFFPLVAVAFLCISAIGASIHPLRAAAATEPNRDCQLINLTGRYLCDPFRTFWDGNQGVEFFGLPLTGAFNAPGLDQYDESTVQYFERQRLEIHPSTTNDSNDIALGRIGVEVLESRGRDWQLLPVAEPDRDLYFPETRHAIDPLFVQYWTGHGLDLGDSGVSFRESLALFGYPISELMIETNSSFDQVVVQWFERARLEYHPGNAPERRVQLGRLGAELSVTEPPPKVSLELVATGLTSPLALVPAVDGSNLLFIVDQIGLVRILNENGELQSTPFLDVRDRMIQPNAGYDERGLLGFAFHPDFTTNGLVYAYYSAPLRAGGPEGWNHTAHISEFHISESDPLKIDPSSERILLEIDEPHWAHNGGVIAFGPDGYLYIGLGDGGHGGDVGLGHVEDWYPTNQGGNGQDIESNLLGSILRIAVAGDGTYSIPADNPFVGRAGLDEIWAYGFRNPFRFSFDRAGEQKLFVGDVGQDRWEEVDIAEAGHNYGWNVKEGFHCFYNGQVPTDPGAICPGIDVYGNELTNPIIEFSNTGAPEGGPGRAVIGGYVYRG